MKYALIAISAGLLVTGCSTTDDCCGSAENKKKEHVEYRYDDRAYAYSSAGNVWWAERPGAPDAPPRSPGSGGIPQW